MASHEHKFCPRCKAPFECKPGSITQCQCYGISFTAEEKEIISTNFYDCLCRNCLMELKQEAKYSSLKEKKEQIKTILKNR
ncbi:cysteine-rich CWC family protein [Solitalea sp. MAHUQ-68]|uniref:Cysteine-rich CWC family protein n=1 Tax=Solitalea agri TaxID=2953739 RepID=A0A9X2F8I5_9SPHI|nr:cysteine-rich CWC family protein [Solitalea agri]MCO4293703.1 cysteine-rich CWC family protein [Solitalea agri]